MQFIVLAACVTLFGGVLLIFEYTGLASDRHEVDRLQKELVVLQAENADVKDALYTATNINVLQARAADFGLTLERRPEYLNERQWLSDSSH